MKIDV